MVSAIVHRANWAWRIHRRRRPSLVLMLGGGDAFGFLVSLDVRLIDVVETVVECLRHAQHQICKFVDACLRLPDGLLEPDRGVAAVEQIFLVDFAPVVFVDLTALKRSRQW